MNAILVCVDYCDLLEITLPRNRHHFNEVIVVCSKNEVDDCVVEICDEFDVMTYRTNAFYERGAVFNKWAALEEGLDILGRKGLLCIMDADIIWPSKLPEFFRPNPGFLYTPFRRMLPTFDPKQIPEEVDWSSLPRHRQEREFAGYSQIFYAEDPVLGPAPWHETNWKHAGGADSFFQQKWPEARKIRPNFDVLHLGPAGVNWCGRASDYTNGDKPEQGSERQQLLTQFFQGRRRFKNFNHEKLDE